MFFLNLEVITGISQDRSDEIPQYHHNFNMQVYMYLFGVNVNALPGRLVCLINFLFNSWKDLIVHRVLMLTLVPTFLKKLVWRLHPRSREYDHAVEELFDFARRVSI